MGARLMGPQAHYVLPHERAALDARGIKPIPFHRPQDLQTSAHEVNAEPKPDLGISLAVGGIG
jgi:hypothetical protein